ncbi:MAG: LapA family protein [Gemmataceae bacterium]
MRAIAFLFLLAFLAAVGIFIYQNQREITVSFLDWRVETDVGLLTIATYVVGMLSGWSLIGIVRRSFRRATDSERYA